MNRVNILLLAALALACSPRPAAPADLPNMLAGESSSNTTEQVRENMSWFTSLTGFREESPEQVRKNLMVEGKQLKSLVNGKAWICGTLEIPSLGELRQRVAAIATPTGRLRLHSAVGNVQTMHTDAANAGAMFQVASQFNLLEMAGPQVTPERGVAIYEHDHTQGPACAISAGAGTIYRNYFAPVNGQIGQTADSQIDCLADLGAALGNESNRLWQMQNGYALPTRQGLEEIDALLRKTDETGRDRLRKLLRIGLHWQTEVTLDHAGHLVSQAYCSALPVAYSEISDQYWESFARLVLEAAYEATLAAAVSNAQQNGSNRLFLTTLGGGAFGNKKTWILDSIRRALDLYRQHNLEVYIVSYGSADPDVLMMIENFNRQSQ
jgi:hypothetical protein